MDILEVKVAAHVMFTSNIYVCADLTNGGWGYIIKCCYKAK